MFSSTHAWCYGNFMTPTRRDSSIYCCISTYLSVALSLKFPLLCLSISAVMLYKTLDWDAALKKSCFFNVINILNRKFLLELRSRIFIHVG